MRILLINPNTSESVTALVTAHVRRIAGDAAEFVPVTARFGAAYIASRAALAVAGHAALDCLAEHVDGCDAVYLACFGDPGLLALREVSPVPVVGMIEASCREAAAQGPRFGIVTGGAAWEPMLHEIVAGLGFGDRLAGVRTVAPTGGEIARDPDAALDALTGACLDCVARDGAAAVILGGAALAGLAERIQPHVPVPVVGSVEAGTRAAIAAGFSHAGFAHGAERRRKGGGLESVGLGNALSRLLAAS